MYKARPIATAAMVVSRVYVIVRANILPVSFLAPSALRVVITAKAIVGTAMNWNRRVKTVAIKLKNSFKVELPIQPNMEPTTRATIHRINCLR